MSRLTGWWSRRGSAAKVELYTRWSFHFFALIEIGFVGLSAVASIQGEPQAGPLSIGLMVLVGAHAVLAALVSSRALDWALDRREQPVRLAVALTVLTAAGALTVIALRATGVIADLTVAAAVVTGLVSFGLGALVLCMRRPRRMLYIAPATAVATGVAAAVMSGHWGEGLGYVIAIMVGGVFLVAACGFSGWLMKIVWELERSRDLKARLAVAEERLRFGRDLHDVMGRNLSVIALKSELAVQLARRERPEAVDQMIEVQRIAQESQREVRDVVRGYREADLRVELEGARGVLGAAGIECAIDPVALELPATVQSVLGWVVRETTTNVLRHGDARRCAISLREKDGSVLLTVRNDGVREGAVMERGSGLAGLRERLATVDGTLEAGPDDAGSFQVTALVPVPVAAAERGVRP
ncbi:histidine kinase [Streptomyces sp. P9(2023)]|uniref:sensor histidine kinase n=1 Tax=Streptomyces sp. P9(2023) TaxID=3064394 RepID=UPI0028F4276B|nr:histidine kinase [Streptomyces sp. P9(2023)]MDT9691815.1 histidine kinase [Streptomyces sp. P9(2023)]